MGEKVEKKKWVGKARAAVGAGEMEGGRGSEAIEGGGCGNLGEGSTWGAAAGVMVNESEGGSGWERHAGRGEGCLVV